jgi:hypothetical protein
MKARKSKQTPPALPRTPCSLLPVTWGERILLVDVSPLTVEEFKTRAIAMLEAHIAWGEMVFPFIKANAATHTPGANEKPLK